MVHAQTCPQVLLDTNDATSVAFRRVNQGIARDLDGLVLVQAFDGNFEVYTGEVGNLECFIFQSGINLPADMNDPNVRFFTFLAPNGLVRTRREVFDPSRNMFVDSGLDPFVDGTIGSETIPYYLILGCDNVLRVFDNSNSSGHPLGTLTPTGNDCNLIPSRPLPTHAPSSSPVKSPTRAPRPPSRCKDAVVMVEHQQANVWEPLDLGNGVYLQQMSSGNAAIRRGTSTDGIDSNDEIIWQTCSMFEDSMNYYTTLQEDSHLVTYLPGSTFKFEASWYRDSFMEMDAVGTWQLKLICDAAQNDYEKLQIVDDAGNVAWEVAQLGPQDCSTLQPVCPTATVLLQMNEALLSSQATKVAGNGYSLDVEDTAVMNLFQEGCVDPVWSERPSTPVTPGTESPNARISKLFFSKKTVVERFRLISF